MATLHHRSVHNLTPASWASTDLVFLTLAAGQAGSFVTLSPDEARALAADLIRDAEIVAARIVAAAEVQLGAAA